MRERSLRSTGPNLVKSTLGQGSRSRPTPVPPPAGALAAWALVCTLPAITRWVKACTSSCEMRPLGPEPWTSASGTPSSRANLRTEGLACGRPPVGVPGWCAGAATAGAAAAGAGGTAAAGAATTTAGASVLIAAGACSAGAAAAFCSDAWAAAPAASSTSTTEPCLTLSPTCTRSSLTTPAWLDGISIDALSDSTVMSDCSALTVSPALTSNSITPTSSKSPMSGTRMSISAMFVSGSVYAYSGLVLSALMPYLAMASATLAAGTVPCSLSALSAATTM